MNFDRLLVSQETEEELLMSRKLSSTWRTWIFIVSLTHRCHGAADDDELLAEEQTCLVRSFLTSDVHMFHTTSRLAEKLSINRRTCLRLRRFDLSESTQAALHIKRSSRDFRRIIASLNDSYQLHYRRMPASVCFLCSFIFIARHWTHPQNRVIWSFRLLSAPSDAFLMERKFGLETVEISFWPWLESTKKDCLSCTEIMNKEIRLNQKNQESRVGSIQHYANISKCKKSDQMQL